MRHVRSVDVGLTFGIVPSVGGNIAQPSNDADVIFGIVVDHRRSGGGVPQARVLGAKAVAGGQEPADVQDAAAADTETVSSVRFNLGGEMRQLFSTSIF